MPERKYTYKVEIDAAQAKATAEALRRQLMDALGDIGAPGARGGLAEVIQAAQKPAQDLNRTLEETQRRVRELRNEYERMNQTAAAANSRGTQRSRANFGTYVEEVRKAAGDDAAAAARRTGRATNIGNLSAEFKDDEAGRYLEAERDALKAMQEMNEKQRFTADEKRQLYEIEAQLTQAELQEIQVRSRIAQEQKADADRLIAAWEESGNELDASTAEIMEGSDRLAGEIRQFAEEEQQMMEAATRAHQRLSELVSQQDNEMRRAAAKAQGQIAAAAPGAGTAYTQQTAITITQASAANAERFAVAMREAAEATERMERARMSTNVRGFEMELEKQKAAIRQASEAMTAMQVEEARQATAVVQQEQRQQTANLQAEAQMRTALVRAEADVARQEARASAGARMEQEKRITAETRAEIRKREREARLAQTATLRPTMGGRPFSVGGAMNNIDMWTGMAAGGLGAFGAVQLAQQTYDSAKQGAILERQQATFREFAKRMGQDANAIIEAVRRASNGTITEFDAMGLSSQVLASKFAQSSTNIAGDLETVVAASRRFSQIFVDENGMAMGTQEIFSRLTKFAREGNKELVDQFGLSNQLIADAMGTTVDGLASAQGATLRWQGLVKVLNGELERLGPAAMTTADRFEQSAARVEDARQRIQMAMAEPVAGIAEGAAGVVEFGATAMGISGLDTVRRQVEENAKYYQVTEQGAAAVESARHALEMYDQAMQTNSESAASYAKELTDMLSLLVKQGTLQPANVAGLDLMARKLDLVAQGLDTYGVAMQVTTMEGVKQSEAIFALVRTMATYENMYLEGGVTLEQYSEQMVALAARMREAADAGGYLSQQLSDTYTMVGPLAQGFERRSAAAAEERAPFLDPEKSPWAPAEGISERQAAAMAELAAWRQQQNEEMNRIIAETQNPAMQNVRTGIVDQLAGAEEALAGLSAAYDMLGESGTAAMTQNLDAISEQINRLQLLDQAAVLVDQAMKNGVSSAGEMASALQYMAAEVSATNTVTAAQVGILQRLIGALLGATSAAMGFAGAQTQYQAAMAAKSAKYEVYAGYNYAALAPRFDNETRSGPREAMYNRVVEERRIAAEAQRAWEGAAKSAASDFEAAAKKSAAAFESALRSVPGLFGTSSVTGDQMAGAAAGVPQNFADNYLRRLADEVAGQKDWEGIDITDAAARAGIDPSLPKEMILEQVRAAWSDSSLFAGGKNLDLITGFGGLDAIKANLARQDASASGEQALMDFLKGQGLGPEGAATEGAVTAENAPANAEATVVAIQDAFSADAVKSQLQAVGENTIAMIHSGYSSNAGKLNWAGPLVDAVAAQVLESLNSALNQP